MKLLVIDDDPSTADLLEAILQTMNIPAAIEQATTGVEGIQKVKETQPDIIILDLVMPEMDGWKVCQEIRQFSNVPILILSALDQPGHVAAALDAGADDYLVKPVSANILVAHLNTLLRRSPKWNTQPFVVSRASF
ncbi:response regulator [Thermanaerothrix sp. 4228-RoL]|jgi:DNA-binding response OmpR family regulator|uniref:Response regulator n=1 Tax=Thermanaerothrix solaris TaxID=3058434 RepID=A0ABU3NRI8_9CHLR|nr:response regulator [Thermanaerothrix sp. 4228-RoL]MDT8899424.1 response regulator [Thermanaerothrix sp. 4228-RoL]